MALLDELCARLVAEARADFAFVLTLKGKLLTKRAPADMPSAGRKALVGAATALEGARRTAVVTLAREQLVPFGGAGPIDVHVGLAGRSAVVCAVLATWTDARDVAPALGSVLDELDGAIGPRASGHPAPPRPLPAPPSSRGQSGRAAKTPRASSRPPASVTSPPAAREAAAREAAARDAAAGGARSDARASAKRAGEGDPKSDAQSDASRSARGGASGARRAPLAGLRGLAVRDTHPGLGELGREPARAERPLRGASAPELTVRDTLAGRETLHAIAVAESREAGRSSMASIELGEAPLGRATLDAIDEAERRDARGREPPEVVVLGEASVGRATQYAIELSLRPSTPDITYGSAPLGRETLIAIARDDVAPGLGSSPHLELGEATLGRESLAAIEAARPSSLVDAFEEDRPTQPYVESPKAASQAFRAARAARKVLPPRVTVRMTEVDASELEETGEEP